MGRFFGVGSPLRLLRETWQTPKMLAEELYAMFTSREPQVIEGPVEIRVRDGQPGLHINQTDRAPAINVNAANRARDPVVQQVNQQFESARPVAFDAFTSPTKRTPDGATSVIPRPLDFATRPPVAAPGLPSSSNDVAFDPRTRVGVAPYEATAFSVNGKVQFSGHPVQFFVPPTIFNPQTQQFQPVSIPGGPVSVLEIAYGTVTGGSGSTWEVTISDSTTAGNIGESVTVVALGVREEEVAPKGAKVGPLTPVDRGGSDKVYVCCPPTWL